MDDLQVVEVKGVRVLTSAQIASCYETTRDCIKKNFHLNKGRFIEGKHYIVLVGDELKKFKNKVTNSNLVLNSDFNEVGKYDFDQNNTQNKARNPHLAADKARYQFNTQFKYAKSLYLWTERGALLHAKSLNTDKAWEVYDYLVDFYFCVKEKASEIQPPAPQTYREKREAALAEARQKETKAELEPRKTGYDIAPVFRELISLLPIEALDEMEKCFRKEKSMAIRLAATSILAEKMKRQLA